MKTFIYKPKNFQRIHLMTFGQLVVTKVSVKVTQ